MRIATTALVALALLLAASAVAAAGTPPRIFVGLGKGYAVAFKQEGEEAFVLAAVAEGRCAVTAEEEGASEYVELESFAAPTPLRPGAGGLQATQTSGGFWDSGSFTVDDIVFGTDVTGELEGSHSGEGEPNCRTGNPAATPPVGPRIAFRAVEYVPVTDPRASAPPAEESPFFYAKTPTLEAYMWTTAEYALGIRGRATLSCTGRPPKSVRRRPSLFRAPSHAELIDGNRFRLARDSALLTGSSTGEAVSGTYRRRAHGRNKGGAWSCRTPSTAYEAVRYVPATGPASSP